ncbi:hypothetical protein, partial [Streptomyces sp. NPDC003036]|uniref:hypothetical protein n=1 Tax=Streptomyces sp. NPDC003036 TaxID=3154442 RepID=UPI0033BF89A9
GLSSGRFPSVFRVSSLADPFSVSATRWSGLPVSSSLSRFSFQRGQTLPAFSRPSDHHPEAIDAEV